MAFVFMIMRDAYSFTSCVGIKVMLAWYIELGSVPSALSSKKGCRELV